MMPALPGRAELFILAQCVSACALCTPPSQQRCGLTTPPCHLSFQACGCACTRPLLATLPSQLRSATAPEQYKVRCGLLCLAARQPDPCGTIKRRNMLQTP